MAVLSEDKQRQITELASLIGNTPLLAIEFRYRGEKRTIYAKAENLNMTGSIKDRMAFHILRRATERQHSSRADSSSRRPAATPESLLPRSAEHSAIPSRFSCPTG